MFPDNRSVMHRLIDSVPYFRTLTLTSLVFGFLILSTTLMPPDRCFAEEVTLAWDAGGSDVAGYQIHYGTERRVYDHTIDVGNHTSCTISGLETDSTYFIAATAYDDEGNMSAYSREVVYPQNVDASSSGGGDSGGGGGGGGGGGCFVSGSLSGLGMNPLYRWMQRAWSGASIRSVDLLVRQADIWHRNASAWLETTLGPAGGPASSGHADRKEEPLR
jgi:hypothetical protein